MRGTDERTGSLFSYVDLEARVRKDHQLRVIRGLVNGALDTMASDFARLYAAMGRPSIVRLTQRRHLRRVLMAGLR